MRLIILVFTFQLFLNELFAQSGILDPDFGQGGWIHTDFGGKDQANAVAIQTDGKILVGGRTNLGSTDYDFALARYLENGDLDPDFGTAGKMTWNFGSSQENIEFIYVLENHDIVLGGFSNNSPNSLAILIKLKPDGMPDPGFGDQGILKYKFGRSTAPLAMAVQQDGKYLVSGLAIIDSFDIDWLVARFYPDGTLDSTFNHKGFTHYNFLTREDIPFSILIQDDGKIFMTGCAGVFPKANFAFLRLNQDGSLDQSFGDNGSLQTDFQDNQDVAYSSVILPDGRFIASGTAKDSVTNLDFALAQYTADGKPDLSFGNNGKITYDLMGPVDYGLYMIRQADGKYLVCGVNNILTRNSYVVVRFNVDGSIDQSFGKNGIAALDVVSILPDNTPSFTMQADGKLVMVANYKDGNNINFLVIRFLNEVISKNSGKEDAQQSIIVYPNPVDQYLEIELQEKNLQSDIQIEILNVQGKLIQKSELTNQQISDPKIMISVKDLKPGYYINKVICNDKIKLIPFVKQ